jgi:hypothetical protein
VLAAAYLALNQRGEGSSPSGPTGTRDVTAACLLAMQDVRVQLPLGALAQDVGKPGNPPVSGTGKRGFKSHRPDFLRCGRMVRRLPVKETIAGSIPTAAARSASLTLRVGVGGILTRSVSEVMTEGHANTNPKRQRGHDGRASQPAMAAVLKTAER